MEYKNELASPQLVNHNALINRIVSELENKDDRFAF